MSYTRPGTFRSDAIITETIIRAMVPNPGVSLITTFHFDEIKNDHSFLFPPILCDSVINLTATDGEHILVYATARFDSRLDLLRSFKRESFIVYGSNMHETEGNLHSREFSNDIFLQDLVSFIATAEFTLRRY